MAWNPEDVPPQQPTIPWSADELAKMAADEAATEAAKTQEDPLVGTLMRNKWRILKRLGAGSFGTVYKVQDVKGGWIEALKILGVDRLTGAEAEEMRKRFLREAQIMKRLGTDSQHIVGLATYEEDIEAGLIYFLMEFVEGKSLGKALETEGPFPVDRTVRLALQACDALMAAHEGPEPVVHRDLKLENLMLTTDRSGEEMIKVLDFGIAKIAEREADSRLTTVGTLGTPGYAAPEQLRAEEVDGRTDLFAFGVILYALLTGRDPWLGKLAHEPTDQIYELMAATDRAEVIPMAKAGMSVPAGMTNVVMRLLQRDPARRFQSARDLRDALLRVAAGDEHAAADMAPAAAPKPKTAAATARPVARPAPKPSRKGRLLALAAVAVLLLGGAWYVQPWGRTMDAATLRSSVQAGVIDRTWLDDGGLGGYVQLGPLVSPFFLSVPESEIPQAVAELREANVFVDTTWEIQRLRDLVIRAQSRTQYYGIAGGDVQSYALRLAAVEPESGEARSLLLKVGERMAWDASAALADGSADEAEGLVRQCLVLVPDHPRCRAVSQELQGA
ncbi:MAG: serine/threonine protein kinase [Gemmatimonadota bacterium]|nr:serine/threonine protein kinase [Gemmatimonadota bacterium]